ncbi:MAG: hypothetical protein KKC84_00190, partial [Candidatus Omnitrophica bacterium]|nr:hypothetical protein [Candidatus Omnitrophota bacterium]
MNSIKSPDHKHAHHPKKPWEYAVAGILIVLSIAFVIYFAGASMIRLYIQIGIGSCEKIPILCKAPDDQTLPANLSGREVNDSFIPHSFPRLSIQIPRGFAINNETEKRPYYKNRRNQDKGSVIYVLRQEPGFFVHLYPTLKKQGIANNRDFVKNTMQARLNAIQNITSAFFVVMKSIFTPDIGDQHQALMKVFRFKEFVGYINYNISEDTHYFDCNLIDKDDDFFKVYIKDT